jgi:hypothetical protein
MNVAAMSVRWQCPLMTEWGQHSERQAIDYRSTSDLGVMPGIVRPADRIRRPLRRLVLLVVFVGRGGGRGVVGHGVL